MRVPSPPSLSQIVAYLDETLFIEGLGDFAGAHNGLQLENGGTVSCLAAAVDGCAFTIDAAVDAGADLLLVHHGLFWNDPVPLVAAKYRRLKRAIEGNLAVYSSHLPLDAHPSLGNNIRLTEALGLANSVPFFEEKGGCLGRRASVELARDELVGRLEKAVGGPVLVCPGGGEVVREVGLVTGGAGAEVARAAGEGVDTFITGEAPQHAYILAEELGVNLLLGGHYATETFGVKALAAHLAERFGLPWLFLDHPTGL